VFHSKMTCDDSRNIWCSFYTKLGHAPYFRNCTAGLIMIYQRLILPRVNVRIYRLKAVAMAGHSRIKGRVANNWTMSMMVIIKERKR
ncbi:hypothetical protein THOM_0299, partial [Trachipleistophora hominis]